MKVVVTDHLDGWNERLLATTGMYVRKDAYNNESGTTDDTCSVFLKYLSNSL